MKTKDLKTTFNAWVMEWDGKDSVLWMPVWEVDGGQEGRGGMAKSGKEVVED